jgi:hypothetical protein
MLLLCGKCFCTTTVFIFTRGQIIAGADHLLVGVPALSGPDTAIKLVLLKNRFIVASAGVETATDGTPPTVVYDFREWIRAIEKTLGPETTILQLANIIEKESLRTFKDLVPRNMNNGSFKHVPSLDTYFVHYYVVAFDHATPTLVHIYYQLDWENNLLIGPKSQTSYPRDGEMNAFGRNCAILEVKNPLSYANKRLQVLAPVAFHKMMAGKKLNSEEGIRAVRSLINIEADVEPTYVGKGSTVIVLPVGANGMTSEYQDFPTLTKPTTKKFQGVLK